MNPIASQIIIDILNNRMGMPANSVWLREQNKTISNDNGLYIAVGMTSAIPLSNNTQIITKTDSSGNPQVYETNTVQLRENIQIDILSRSDDALLRHWEVIAAIQSFYSQQQQEKYNFKIFRIPLSFLDTSITEGGSILKKYSITISAFTWYKKETLLGDYYDDFKTRVDDEKTIGTDTPLIEFEINSGGIVP